jgi:hypothetical protein
VAEGVVSGILSGSGVDVGPLRDAAGMRECDCGCVLVASDEPEPMGDTLVHYARPLLERYPKDLSLEELKAIIDFAAFLWNLAAVEDIQRAVRHLERAMPPRLRIDAPKGLAVIRRLLTRKDSDFASDGRLALKIDVTQSGDRICVKALGVRFEPGPAPSTSPLEQAELAETKPHRVLH